MPNVKMTIFLVTTHWLKKSAYVFDFDLYFAIMLSSNEQECCIQPAIIAHGCLNKTLLLLLHYKIVQYASCVFKTKTA